MSDLYISAFTGLISVLHYLAPRGSFISMHAQFEVISYDTTESLVLLCLCPAVICEKMKISEN